MPTKTGNEKVDLMAGTLGTLTQWLERNLPQGDERIFVLNQFSETKRSIMQALQRPSKGIQHGNAKH